MLLMPSPVRDCMPFSPSAIENLYVSITARFPLPDFCLALQSNGALDRPFQMKYTTS